MELNTCAIGMLRFEFQTNYVSSKIKNNQQDFCKFYSINLPFLNIISLYMFILYYIVYKMCQIEPIIRQYKKRFQKSEGSFFVNWNSISGTIFK